MALTGTEPWYEQTAQVIFYLTPAFVFILTGLLAAWRFNIFRTAKPAIKIDLEVTSPPQQRVMERNKRGSVGDQYVSESWPDATPCTGRYEC